MTQRQIKFRAWNNRKCAWVDHHGRCVDWYSHGFEIIGNQFENPELLGESND